MIDSYRVKLESYLASMLQAKKMQDLGILTSKDYISIDTIIADKYGVSSYSIYRGIDLIYDGYRVNMVHYEEDAKCKKA